MPGPKPPCRHSFPSVCIFRSWPLSICLPKSVFFFSLPFIHGVIFLSPTVTSSPEAFFSWEAERACIAFSNEEEGFAFFISSLLFTCCPAPCVPALSLFHLLTNSSSCTLSFTLDLSFLFLSFYSPFPKHFIPQHLLFSKSQTARNLMWNWKINVAHTMPQSIMKGD